MLTVSSGHWGCGSFTPQPPPDTHTRPTLQLSLTAILSTPPRPALQASRAVEDLQKSLEEEQIIVEEKKAKTQVGGWLGGWPAGLAGWVGALSVAGHL